MNNFLILLLVAPFLGFGCSLFVPEKKEKVMSWLAFSFVGAQLLISFLYIGIWIQRGGEPMSENDYVIYSTPHYRFFLSFYFDQVTAVFLGLGSFITLMVTVYCRYYLHREEGYKRFFCNMLFFFLGYTITAVSGNFETLFVGWEVLGISSFLLIGFYRKRYLPVKNSVKVFSVYRMGDIGIILAMWLSHHMWQENVTFTELNNYAWVEEHIQQHGGIALFISLMILLAAIAKSAQFPFSSWLPRAMEGPTPSSAIFYGSLAVHMGAFLLLRTSPLWEHQLSMRLVIILMGILTCLVATVIARVQSTVKSQIAYASIAQIGLIFVEIALGFYSLACLHLIGNACLRGYQLLTSPSVVTYMIREQHYTPLQHHRSIERYFPKKLAYTFYTLSLKEWNLDSFLYQYLWNPLKLVGRKLDFLNLNRLVIFFALTYAAGLYALYHQSSLGVEGHTWYIPEICGGIGFLLALKAFTERNKVVMAWVMLIMNHFWVVLAVSFNEHFDFGQVHFYLIGVVLSGGLGLWCLSKLRRSGLSLNLNRFHGHSAQNPILAIVFLIACLGLSGFPITPTFIGEDLAFSHIHEEQYLLAFFTAMSLVVDGLAIIRIYARVFLGPVEPSYVHR